MNAKPLRFLSVIFALVLCAGLFAQSQSNYAQVNFCIPGSSNSPMGRDQFVKVVVDGPVILCESDPVPDKDVVAYVNGLLQKKSVFYVGVYIREGTSFSDVMRAIDLLRKTNTKSIGVSSAALSARQNP